MEINGKPMENNGFPDPFGRLHVRGAHGCALAGLQKLRVLVLRQVLVDELILQRASYPEQPSRSFKSTIYREKSIEHLEFSTSTVVFGRLKRFLSPSLAPPCDISSPWTTCTAPDSSRPHALAPGTRRGKAY